MDLVVHKGIVRRILRLVTAVKNETFEPFEHALLTILQCAELGRLQKLQTLDLYNNLINGEIPFMEVDFKGLVAALGGLVGNAQLLCLRGEDLVELIDVGHEVGAGELLLVDDFYNDALASVDVACVVNFGERLQRS
ncbi:hypothetical protein ACFX1T_007485 [Malus domestica]